MNLRARESAFWAHYSLGSLLVDVDDKQQDTHTKDDNAHCCVDYVGCSHITLHMKFVYPPSCFWLQ